MGGVATAARLAKAGFDVTVFEKNDFTGGRCSLIYHGGHVRYSSLQISPPLFFFKRSKCQYFFPSVSIKDPLSSSSHTYSKKYSPTSILPSKQKA